PVLKAPLRFSEDTCGQCLRGLDKDWVVKQCQCLQRCRRTNPPAAGRQRIGCVKGHKLGIGCRTLKACIEPTAVTVPTLSFLPLAFIRQRTDTGGLRRVNTLAPDCRVK